MRLRGHACGKAALPAELKNFIGIGRHHDLVEQRTTAHAVIHTREQRLAGNLAQHLAGQAGRGQPRRNYGHSYHAPQFRTRPGGLTPSSTDF